MEMVKFKVSELYEEGWRLTKEHLWFLLGFQFILYLLSSLILGGYLGFIKSFLVYIALFLMIVIAKIGFFRSSLLIADGIKPTYEQLYINWKLFASWIVACVIFEMMFAIGLALFIIPGIYVLARFSLFPYFIVDKGLGSVDAMREVFRASKPYVWDILRLFFAGVLLNLAGALFFGIGLFITIPITMIAYALAYRRITANPV